MSAQLGLFASAPSLEDVNRIKLAASYSADAIAMTGTVRRPHLHDGALWVHTGNGKGGSSVWRLVPFSEFDGEPTTYNEKTLIDGGDYARHDPMGFHHGMTVKHGRERYIIHGPEIVLDGDILAESWAEERTRIGNIPSEDFDDEEDETAGEDFDDGGRTAMGNEYSDGEDGEDGDDE